MLARVFAGAGGDLRGHEQVGDQPSLCRSSIRCRHAAEGRAGAFLAAEALAELGRLQVPAVTDDEPVRDLRNLLVGFH